MFLEISQNSQENTCARVSFLIKLQASGRIIKLTSECHLIFKAAIFENKSAKFENYPFLWKQSFSFTGSIRKFLKQKTLNTLHNKICRKLRALWGKCFSLSDSKIFKLFGIFKSINFLEWIQKFAITAVTRKFQKSPHFTKFSKREIPKFDNPLQYILVFYRQI